MKKTLITIALLYTGLQAFAQLNVKSGIVYYKFEESMKSKSCLANYFNPQKPECTQSSISNKVTAQLMDYAQNKNSEGNKSWTKHKSGITMIIWAMPLMVQQIGNDCSASNMPTEVFITLPSHWKPVRLYESLGIGKKTRITSHTVSFTPIVEFSNGKYVMKVKGVTYKMNGTVGSKPFVKTQPLGEVYEKYQNDTKKSDEEGKMFAEVDKIINLINSTVKKELEKAIARYELD